MQKLVECDYRWEVGWHPITPDGYRPPDGIFRKCEVPHDELWTFPPHSACSGPIAPPAPSILKNRCNGVHQNAPFARFVFQQVPDIKRLTSIADGAMMHAKRIVSDFFRRWIRLVRLRVVMIVAGLDYDNVGIEGRLNGEVKQKSNANDLLSGSPKWSASPAGT